MNNKEIVSVLNELELSLEREHIHYDPNYLIVLRAYLFLRLRGTNDTQAASNGTNNRGALFGVLRGLYALAQFLFSRSKVFVFGPSAHRTTLIGDNLYSKVLDSLVYFLKRKNAVPFEFGRQQFKDAPLNFSYVIDLCCKFLPLSKSKASSISELSEFVADFLLKLEVIESRDTLFDLEASLIRYEKRVDFFRLILSVRPIDSAYFVAYYDLNFLAMIRVLRDKNIEVFEYQHGIQSAYQPMYAHLRHISKVAPNSLPNHFLTWNSTTRNRIHSDLANARYDVSCLGYLWKDLYESLSTVTAPGWCKDKTILLALQAFPRYFNFDVIDAIKMLDSDWTVIVKEHPLARMLPEDLDKYFSQRNYRAKVVVDDGSVLLDALLESCSFCITGFSTVGYEAYLMGQKTIFTHQNALDGLSDYIDGVDIVFCETCSEILSVLIPNED